MDEKKDNTLGSQLGNDKYQGKQDLPKVPSVEEMEKIKGKLEDLKKKIVKKYPFAISLSILPGQASRFFEEDEGLPKEIVDTKPMHLFLMIPEEQYKNVPKIKPEIVKFVKESKENIWVHIKTPVDLWNYGLDSKFEFVEAIGMSLPLHDKGLLGALRIVSIHKSLVLRKFEKYVASYVIGGSLVRGTADKTSDVDTFVIIDDTDVKRMPRIELLEKLRGIIYDYIREATALAGVKNILNVQVYLLTDFWQSVKDAHPVMFTFIRDGVPLYDRGTFLPWKLLLQMGKIKPSPEAIDLFMKSGEQTEELVKRRLIDAMIDSYYGVLTPTQALMMLAGEAPPVPKTVVEEVRKVLVEKEKLMKPADLKTLEKAVKYFKDYEHGKLKEISGKEVDELLKETNGYVKMLKSLREKIEKRMGEHDVDKVYNEVFELLKKIFGSGSQEHLINEFEAHLVNNGKMPGRLLGVLKDIASVKRKVKAGKLNQKEVDAVKRDASELVSGLTEYAQRKDLAEAEKGLIKLSYGKGKKAELVLMGDENYIIMENGIKKISAGKLHDSDRKEFEEALAKHRKEAGKKVSGEVWQVLRKELGEFEIIL